MNRLHALTTALDRTMATHAPDWTNRNDADPGIILLEVMAFLAEQLPYGAPTGGRGVAAASRIVSVLETRHYIHSETRVLLNEHWSGTVRPRSFEGRALTADDLNTEQEYHRAKHRRHLQKLHGAGIVEGLRVEGDADGARITIGPGLAIDAYGREIVVNDTATLAIPPGSPSPVCVVAQNAERLIEPVPLLVDAETMDGTTEPSRVEGGCLLCAGEASDE